jgi:hypothetical protein
MKKFFPDAARTQIRIEETLRKGTPGVDSTATPASDRIIGCCRHQFIRGPRRTARAAPSYAGKRNRWRE